MARSAAITKPRIESIKNCFKCGKAFKCISIETKVDKTTNAYCSRSCANFRVFSDSHKKNIYNALVGKTYPERHKREIRECLICGLSFEEHISSKQKTCSKECGNKLASQKLKWSGKVGGYKIKSGKSKFHGEYFNEIWMDSSSSLGKTIN